MSATPRPWEDIEYQELRLQRDALLAVAKAAESGGDCGLCPCCDAYPGEADDHLPPCPYATLSTTYPDWRTW